LAGTSFAIPVVSGLQRRAAVQSTGFGAATRHSWPRGALSKRHHVALILSAALLSGLAGCGLEMITAFPLLLSPHEAVGPQAALSSDPTQIELAVPVAPLATTLTTEPEQAAAPSNAQSGAVVKARDAVLPSPAQEATPPPPAQEATPHECDCVGITCQQPVEACGQFSAPYLSVPTSSQPLLHPSPLMGTRGSWEEQHSYRFEIGDPPLQSLDDEWITFWFCSGFAALRSPLATSNDPSGSDIAGAVPNPLVPPPDCRAPG
jgi:hypothetical protein